MTAPPPSPFAGLHVGLVRDNADSEDRGRVQVELPALGITLWAPCAMPSAGGKYGVQLLPRKDEVVVVGFVSPEFPVVMGALWTGKAKTGGDQSPVQSRYCITTPKGTVMLFDDDDGPQLKITTPQGNQVQVTDGSGGQVKIDVQGTTVTVTSSKVEVQASASVEVTAAQVKISASQVTVDAGMVNCSGVVKCTTLMADAVISSSYTPGAGNIW
jgi:uncharacterized protein involved in type VI secretion and phage assembly